MIPGLQYIENVISSEYADQLLHYLDHEAKWVPISNYPNSRVVQHYGYKYNYLNYHHTEKADPIPEIFAPLVDLIKQKHGDISFNQVIVNNYQPGQGISKHIDLKSFGPVIGCFTIGSGATMRFRKRDQVEDLFVKPNSVYLMTGEARYQWTHEMPSTITDKVDG
jgi:alkylated DNA repair dioxygenase AlkB